MSAVWFHSPAFPSPVHTATPFGFPCIPPPLSHVSCWSKQKRGSDTTVDTWAQHAFDDCCNSTDYQPNADGCWVPSPDCSSADAFEDSILSWVHDRVVPVAGVMFAVAALQLVTCVATCTIVGRRKREERAKADREAAATSSSSSSSAAAAADGGAYAAPVPAQSVYVAIAPVPYGQPVHGGESRFQ